MATFLLSKCINTFYGFYISLNLVPYPNVWFIPHHLFCLPKICGEELEFLLLDLLLESLELALHF
jgi:hypothetical protein